MSATISLMYKRSGGCDREHICRGCSYLEKAKTKTYTSYHCTFHKIISGEIAAWKPDYMACKNYLPKGKPRFKEQKDGQLSLF